MSWSFSFRSETKESAIAELATRTDTAAGDLPSAVAEPVKALIQSLPLPDDSHLVVESYGHFDRNGVGSPSGESSFSLSVRTVDGGVEGPRESRRDGPDPVVVGAPREPKNAEGRSVEELQKHENVTG